MTNYFKSEYEKELQNDFNINLAEIIKYPILPIEQNHVVKKDKPYGHVERYGAIADPAHIIDSSAAIQTAYDIAEKIGIGGYSPTIDMCPVLYGLGPYMITKTIKMKYNTSTCNSERPIKSKGIDLRIVGAMPNKGTIIYPKIPNHTGKTYANAFAINVNYNSDVDEDDTITFGGLISSPMMDNIAFENISFVLSDADALIYNINAIKCYRTRLDIKHVNFNNLNSGILQPGIDRLSGENYCDFSNYEDINLYNMKYRGLSLFSPDNTSLKRITNSSPQSTFDCELYIEKGAGITINNFTATAHGSIDVNGNLIPRNDATGITGTKAIIKLVNCYGLTINGIYTERPFADYMFNLNSCSNIKITNYYERYVGNGFISLSGTCKSIKLENIYRESNILSEFSDIYCASGLNLSGLKVENFVCKNYFNESFALATTDYNNFSYTVANEVYRHIKKNYSLQRTYVNISGEDISLIVEYTGTRWKVTDLAGDELTSAVDSLFWDVGQGGLSFVDSSLFPFRIKSITPLYIDATTLPYLPLNRPDYTIVSFMNIATSARVTTPDTRMVFLITLNSVFNLKMFGIN